MRIATFAIAFSLLLSAGANAQPTNHSIAVRFFTPAALAQEQSSFATIVRGDLGIASFETTDSSAEALPGVHAPPNFEALATAGNDAALIAEIARRRDGALVVSYRVWDVAALQQLASGMIATRPEAFRRLAHRTSDNILAALGDGADFDSRIVALTDGGRLLLLDSDGANPSFLTAMGNPSNPVFAESHAIYFIDEGAGGTRLHGYQLETARRSIVRDDVAPIASAGLAAAARSLAFAAPAEGGDVDVGVASIGGNDSQISWRRLAGWQGAPTLSADGLRIAFLSEIGADRRILIGALTDQGVSPIGPTGDYRSLAWSRQGDAIAFVRRTATGEELGILQMSDGSTRIVANAPSIALPSWSPSGRRLLAVLGGELTILDLNSGRRTRIPTPVAVKAANWSPLAP